MSVSVRCSFCGTQFDAFPGAVNRAKKRGAPMFCSMACSGLNRRKYKSVDQKRAEKSAYDKQRRIDLSERLKAEKAAYHLRTYDPASAAAKRKDRMPKHVEYCRQPEYREWKAAYDRQYRATKEFGEFAECFLLTQDIRAECLSRMTDYDIRQSVGTNCKSTQRRRAYERLNRQQSENGPLGNPSSHQGGQFAAG